MRTDQLRDYLDSNHAELVASGCRLLQPHRFASTDQAHVQVLIDVAAFPTGARVLDIGCGLGECARLMAVARPDLRFALLNFSAMQLADCPPVFERHLGDAHDMPFASDSFDGAMFNAALGQMDMEVAMLEAARVLRPGGVLLVNEVMRIAGGNEALQRMACYRASTASEVLAASRQSSLALESEVFPQIHRNYLAEVWPDNAGGTYEEAFFGTRPVIWRFRKVGHEA